MFQHYKAKGVVMKSIVSYFIILFTNLVIFTPIYASEQPIARSNNTITFPTEPDLTFTEAPVPLAARARRISDTLENYIRAPQESSNPSLENFKFGTSTRSLSIEPQENKIEQARRLSIWDKKDLASNAEPATTSEQNNKIQITLTHEQLIALERGTVGISVLACFWMHAQKTKNQVRYNDNMPVRGIPTDAVGVGFWVVNGLREFASTGLMVAVGLYAGHKIKGWVDTIYGSDTDRRITRALNPVQQDLTQLAFYVDERIEPLATGQRFLCDVANDLTAGQNLLVHTQQETSKVVCTLAEDYEARHPNNTKATELTTNAQNITAHATQASINAQQLAQKIKGKDHRNIDPKNPITTKENSSQCCGCTIM